MPGAFGGYGIQAVVVIGLLRDCCCGAAAAAAAAVGCCHVQVNGHFDATLDPLGLDKRPRHEELNPASYGFTEADLDRE
jgi:hypothetical protein